MCIYTVIVVLIFLMREWCVLPPLELCNCYNFNLQFLVHRQELSDHLLCVCVCVIIVFLDEYLCCSCAFIYF